MSGFEKFPIHQGLRAMARGFVFLIIPLLSSGCDRRTVEEKVIDWFGVGRDLEQAYDYSFEGGREWTAAGVFSVKPTSIRSFAERNRLSEVRDTGTEWKRFQETNLKSLSHYGTRLNPPFIYEESMTFYEAFHRGSLLLVAVKKEADGENALCWAVKMRF